MVCRAHRAGATPRRSGGDRRRVHPELLARLGARLRARAAVAAPFFPSIEIVEAHRETKVDSPSGTAIRTAELIAAARVGVGPVESPHVDQRARGQQVASVPDPLAAPARCGRASGDDPRRERGSPSRSSTTPSSPRSRTAPASGSPFSPRATPAESPSDSTASSISASVVPIRAPNSPVDEGGVPGQVARATGA